MTAILENAYLLNVDKDGFVLGASSVPIGPDFEEHLQNLGYTRVDKEHYDNVCTHHSVNWKYINNDLVDAGPSVHMMTTQVKKSRDYYLASSDWTAVSDVDMSDEKKSEWKKYRQDLRDVTSQPGYPETIVWPTKPVGK